MTKLDSTDKQMYKGVQGNLPGTETPFIGTFAKVYPKGKAYDAETVAFGTVTRIRQLVNGDVSYRLAGAKGGTFRLSEYDIILHSIENPELRKRYGISNGDSI